jgi:hypothetical protein
MPLADLPGVDCLDTMPPGTAEWPPAGSQLPGFALLAASA